MRSTGQRTHRYLRSSLVAVVLALGVAVAIETIRTGDLLASVSAYYYTPARSVFVASLCAAAVALASLSGRDVESVLLDVAAVFAPLIAIIPTGFRGDPRVPPAEVAAVYNGVGTYLVILTCVVGLAVFLTLRGEIPWRRTAWVGGVAAATGGAIATLAYTPGIRESFPFPGGVDLHLVVTVAFFAAFAAVPVAHALPRRHASGDAPSRALRALYLAIPALMVLTLVTTVTVGPRWPDAPIVFVGEAIALGLFAVFWAAQTVERWDQADPPSVVAAYEPLTADRSSLIFSAQPARCSE